jgi:hypothetical protein
MGHRTRREKVTSMELQAPFQAPYRAEGISLLELGTALQNSGKMFPEIVLLKHLINVTIVARSYRGR